MHGERIKICHVSSVGVCQLASACEPVHPQVQYRSVFRNILYLLEQLIVKQDQKLRDVLLYFGRNSPPPPVGQDRLFHDVSRSRSTTHHSR
jgi:hypothetical protein